MVYYRSKATGNLLNGCTVELICRECGEESRANYEEVEVSIFDLIKDRKKLAAVKMYRDLHPGADFRVCMDKVNMIEEDMKRRGIIQ